MLAKEEFAMAIKYNDSIDKLLTKVKFAWVYSCIIKAMFGEQAFVDFENEPSANECLCYFSNKEIPRLSS